ncbi:MAG: hypothetical protein DRP11_02910 [Candidatus Aenigmatarchaeota archaeon]|nr:MAG: hypothetical protein DRP11_02910 [Candidatus Aenigmarchaeota archaeon]
MKMSEISVLIPVYKESKLLEKMLQKLLLQKISKEIFVIIDEPTEKSIEISKKFGGEVNFILNKKRVGKAGALNKAVKISSGKILLFLDDDIELPDKPDFLKTIKKEMEDADILDIKKEVIRTSFLSKMTYYEYVGFNIGSWLVARFIGKSPAVNGAAFAMRRDVFDSIKGFRKVVSEDLDIATRSFLKGYRFKYTKNVEVYNHVHSSWKKWIKQRRRWVTGAALWFKEWYKPLLKESVRRPQIFIPALIFVFPSLIIFLTAFLLPDLLIYKLFSILLLFLIIKFNIVLPFLLFTSLGIIIFKSLLFSLIGFLLFTVLFFVLSNRLNFRVKFHEFFVYYFFYSLVSLFFMIAGLIKVFIFNKKSVPDWKI